MDFNYRSYVERYTYQPSNWPPDIGLAELHARCSEPGPANNSGIQCPCCSQLSKRKVKRWWRRDITEDLKEFGSAIPGYFQLIKYYGLFMLSVLLVNSIYPIYATYYACAKFEEAQDSCLQVGALFYLQFNTLITLLAANDETKMVNTLQILQTVVFYILLFANFFSVFFITFHNASAVTEIKQAKARSNKYEKCLVFYNLPEKIVSNLSQLSLSKGKEGLGIVRSLQLFKIKNYYTLVSERNKAYYRLLSILVEGEDPFKQEDLNQKLQKLHEETLEQKKWIGKFTGKVLILFQDVESKKIMHQMYKLSLFKQWYYGFRTILKQIGIWDFDPTKMQIAAFEVKGESDIRWQNLGQPMGIKMATRIKTFFVSVLFIGVCYVVLVYPLLFSLKTHIKAETQKFVHLNTFEKFLPAIISFFLVALSISFRVYMNKLGEQRNPKDEVQKSKFVLLSVVTFHIIFYILLPTFFFMFSNDINPTVKLYVISQQARTFILVQLIIVIVDIPFRMWKNKKVRSLSDQRYAFRSNQKMLHKMVESRDYPLEIRLQVLFRIWSLGLFYCFYLPYIIFYIMLALLIIFWVQKKNLYKHYSIHRKISIKLQTEILTFFINFFCIYLCGVYCFSVNSSTKIIVAICITVTGMVATILYWIVLNKADHTLEQMAENQISLNEEKEVSLLKRSRSENEADFFVQTYKQFIKENVDDQLDEEISQYVKKYKNGENQSEAVPLRSSSMEVQMSAYQFSGSESDEDDLSQSYFY